MTIWLTADTHWGHNNVRAYCHRPFDDVYEMDRELIRRWNERVEDTDTVYHLGDFTLAGIDTFQSIASALKGDLKIIPGSHDRRWLDDFDPGDPYNITLGGFPITILPSLVSLEFPNGKHPRVLVLCHYAMYRWDRSHHGALHCFGHSHGTVRGLGRSMDVGVDTHGFYPYSLEEVIARLEKIEPPDKVKT